MKRMFLLNNCEPSLLQPDHKPRSSNSLIPPSQIINSQNHSSKQTLAHKSTILKTSNSILHSQCSWFPTWYKDHDPITNPEPTLCLKLSDCELGNSHARSGKAGFTIRGKDAGKYFGGRTHIFRMNEKKQVTQ